VNLPPPEPPPEPAPAPARILIAEDNLVNRMYVERLLARMGHTAASAVDGREALLRYEAGDYDAILMDCQMPELDGYDTTREIRRREAASGRARIPILAMTAGATEEIRRKCLDAGMDDYLTKPLGDGDLQQVLALWLPEASPTGAAAPLDQSRIERLRSVFPGEEATTMLVRIAAEVMNELARLEDGLSAGDHAGAAAAAHSIRGSAQMIGASGLSDAAAEVELVATERPASDERIFSGVAALREAWEQTRRGIEAQVEADRRGYHPGEAAD
jgi:two-component system sensor histidine kinase/response regulator